MTIPRRAHIADFPLAFPFERLYAAAARRPFPFILDSSLRDGRLGRWSFMGFDPACVLTAAGRQVVLREGTGERVSRESPFSALRQLLGRWPFERDPEGPPFVGGAVGYFGYDLKNLIERLPDTVAHDIPLPEMALGIYSSVLAFDHVTGRCVVSVCDLTGRSSANRARHEAIWLRRWRALVDESLQPPAPRARPPAAGCLRSNFRREDYLRAVERVLAYIGAGDIFQVNLSQRFSVPMAADPFCLYERLREANPAPFAAFLGYPSGAVLSSSPERFLKVVDGHVETRPIKGTRPRTGDAATDLTLRQELLASAKDLAELTMIVDLERNDLGRVCEYGSVRVTEKRVLEAYARVFHLVATVEGDLHPRHDVVDLLKATFPGGSITGAPKIRAMEIIDELEPTARSVYTGAIGYLGVDGACDLNIAIRTILAANGIVHAQVGGGIVADSRPDAEYAETLDKGRALFAALGSEVEEQ